MLCQACLLLSWPLSPLLTPSWHTLYQFSFSLPSGADWAPGSCSHSHCPLQEVPPQAFALAVQHPGHLPHQLPLCLVLEPGNGLHGELP